MIINKQQIFVVFFFSLLYSNPKAPKLFDYNQSTFQSFYFFKEVTIDSIKIESDDWVGTFNCSEWDKDSTKCVKLGTCVGSRQYNYALCGGGICDLPAMGAGEESSETTQGYFLKGEYPVFIIYDNSSGVYYSTEASGDVKVQKEICKNGYPFCYAWENFSFVVSERLNANNIYMDCSGKLGGNKIIDSCGVCGGSGPQYFCEGDQKVYCTEYEYQQKCIK